jgi:hypothetical protein
LPAVDLGRGVLRVGTSAVRSTSLDVIARAAQPSLGARNGRDHDTTPSTLPDVERGSYGATVHSQAARQRPDIAADGGAPTAGLSVSTPRHRPVKGTARPAYAGPRVLNAGFLACRPRWPRSGHRAVIDHQVARAGPVRGAVDRRQVATHAGPRRRGWTGVDPLRSPVRRTHGNRSVTATVYSLGMLTVARSEGWC